MTERSRDELHAAVNNVLVDLADFIMAAITCERDQGQEWGYDRRDKLSMRKQELCNSIVELLMPQPKDDCCE